MRFVIFSILYLFLFIHAIAAEQQFSTSNIVDTFISLKLVTFGSILALPFPSSDVSYFPTQNPLSSSVPKVNAGCTV